MLALSISLAILQALLVNMLPVCDVVAESITWISYAEVTDYSGPMVATYSGVVTAELSCVALTASLRIKPDST